MTDDPEFAFALPPFNPDEALLQLRRALRDLKLAERGKGFELRGRRVAEASVEGGVVQARIARKLALTPEWDRQTITSVEGQRKWLAEFKQRLARWASED